MSVRQFSCLLVGLVAAFFGLYRAANAQTEFPPAYNNLAHYAVGDLVTDYGNIYRCEVAVIKPYLDPSKTYQNWELFYVRSNTTIPIGKGQAFPNLAIAWKYVHNAKVAQDAYLHLSIVSTGGGFNESFSTPLNLDMDNGGQVSILGDNATNVTLSFPSSNGLSIDSGHSLASISNLTLAGGQQNWGIYATSKSSILNLSNLNITGFNYQIYADQSAQITGGNGIALTNCINDGCYALNGASIVLNGHLTFSGNPNSGVGLHAEYGGRIHASGASITRTFDGVYAIYGGVVECDDAAFTNCFNGCVASYGGVISARFGTCANSGQNDIVAANLGIVDAENYVGTLISASGGGMVYTSG